MPFAFPKRTFFKAEGTDGQMVLTPKLPLNSVTGTVIGCK